ncbi:hypothetical protein SanaruYs_20920 [Chryseotalea sanaruensis]|uniref:Uncharacterized protein n=1 Tax=Chryseotalea sanaruensis TaxID=2482724 RepID=A0A401UAD0_9BACT|nr:hypothetical protein [Chryseotalea sanaruensis]GCC51863.1 hypothetical protein SanaruYs_20920 [Chryseotalea sanaruensis]
MAIERDLELMDDYLANRMPVEERVAFEKRIENEPALQKEIKLQNNVVASLRNARMAELKNMLNNVPVNNLPASNSTVIIKVVAGIAISTLIGTSIYYFLNQPTKQEVVKPSQREVAEVPDENPAPGKEEPQPGTEQPLIIEEEDNKKSQPLNGKKKARKEVPPAPVADPQIEVFDPTAELEDGSNEPHESEILTNDDIPSTFEPSILVTVDSTSRRHNFHYKLEEDALLLYGPFEKNLFEILEFISDNKRTAFLYYKNSYYFLKETDKTLALTPVQDPALLNKLRKYRTKN